ncbi:MAG: hypothetical protein ACRCUP_03015 [Mycoplasmatales bacterium]
MKHKKKIYFSTTLVALLICVPLIEYFNQNNIRYNELYTQVELYNLTDKYPRNNILVDSGTISRMEADIDKAKKNIQVEIDEIKKKYNKILGVKVPVINETDQVKLLNKLTDEYEAELIKLRQELDELVVQATEWGANEITDPNTTYVERIKVLKERIAIEKGSLFTPTIEAETDFIPNLNDQIPPTTNDTQLPTEDPVEPQIPESERPEPETPEPETPEVPIN